MMCKVAAIIPVAGKGKRFGGAQPKQYCKLGAYSILYHTLSNFLSVDKINLLVVVVSAGESERTKALLGSEGVDLNRLVFVEGGRERQDSVANGLDILPEEIDIVSVHDGVRPFIKPEIIRSSIAVAERDGACIVAVPVKDTIKEVKQNRVLKTLPRENLYQVQTPQTFKSTILKSAHKKAAREKYYTTDESALVEWAGYPVTIVPGEYRNIKITTQEDYQFALQLLKGEAKACE
jgi:2-C-methyl-D-erythritol 4-phosphate cytidylyltransferase